MFPEFKKHLTTDTKYFTCQFCETEMHRRSIHCAFEFKGKKIVLCERCANAKSFNKNYEPIKFCSCCGYKFNFNAHKYVLSDIEKEFVFCTKCRKSYVKIVGTDKIHLEAFVLQYSLRSL